RKLGESDGRLRVAVDVRGLLRILRLAVLRARRGRRCRGSFGLRPLFLTLLAAFRVRSHICLLLVNPPLDAGACLAQIYPVHNLPNTPDPGPTLAAGGRWDRGGRGGRRPAMPRAARRGWGRSRRSAV